MKSSKHNNKPLGHFSDKWELHKDDPVWRRFWALWELRRKWKWADWFYQLLDRAGGEIVETEFWGLFPGENYMKLCLWIALLRSVHEGLTENLDSFDTPKDKKIEPRTILPAIPASIKRFPSIKGSPFRDFRNAIFHCQWSPTFSKFNINRKMTNRIEALHINIGTWLYKEFRLSFLEFKKKYETPPYWVYDPEGNEWMPECFY